MSGGLIDKLNQAEIQRDKYKAKYNNELRGRIKLISENKKLKSFIKKIYKTPYKSMNWFSLKDKINEHI